MSDPRAPRPELVLPAALRAQLAACATSRYPREACGLLIGRRARATSEVVLVIEARNQSTASDRFALDPRDQLAAEELASARGLEVLGVWHSHPDRPARPSRADRAGLAAADWDACSYAIVSVWGGAACELRSWRHAGAQLQEEIVRTAASETRRLHESPTKLGRRRAAHAPRPLHGEP